MKAPKLSDYVHTRDGLAALPVYRTTNEDGQEICTILRPDASDGEEINETWTLRDYLFYVQAHPQMREANDAVEILEELANLTD